MLFRSFSTAIAASILFAFSASAQLATTTALVGTVTDPSGNVIAGAEVTALNVGTSDTFKTTTNEQGYYNIQFIRAGRYEVSVSHPGFQAVRKTGIVVDTNQIVRNDLTLQVGSVTESVTVAATASVIKTDDASVSEVINTRAVADLPLNGRDPLKLATTTPGVIQGLKPTNGVPPGQDFIGAGTREIQNNMSLDGISILNNLINTTSMRPTVDSVQEVQVQTDAGDGRFWPDQRCAEHRILLEDKLRPGDIYTHCYSGHREELTEDGKVNPAMVAGRKRGIYFDIGHGAGSFYWYVAVPFYEQGFRPDSVSTDLHSGSMNGGMKDILNVMSKLLNLGSSLQEVIAMATWTPAKEIKRPALGNLDVGAEADIAVLRVDKGKFGFVDSAGARRNGNQIIVAEMTLRAGNVMWDLNGRGSTDWKSFPYQKKSWRQ